MKLNWFHFVGIGMVLIGAVGCDKTQTQTGPALTGSEPAKIVNSGKDSKKSQGKMPPMPPLKP
jgi:hypothetical protein